MVSRIFPLTASKAWPLHLTLDSSSDSPNQNRLMHIYVFATEQWMLFISWRTKDRALCRHTHVHSMLPYTLTSLLVYYIKGFFWPGRNNQFWDLNLIKIEGIIIVPFAILKTNPNTVNSVEFTLPWIQHLTVRFLQSLFILHMGTLLREDATKIIYLNWPVSI